MEIWRLEHKNSGHGPYAMGLISSFTSQNLLPEIDSAPEDCGEMPEGWVCGCPSEETVKWMFAFVLDYLLIMGFVIRKYDIPDGNYIMGKSGKQLVFKKPTKTDIAKKVAAKLKLPVVEIKIFD